MVRFSVSIPFRAWLPKIVAIGVLAISLMVLAAPACSRAQPSQRGLSQTSASQTRQLYPDFPILFYQGQDMVAEKEPRFSSLLTKGRPVVLNFWASNCPPCSAEMPEFQKVYESYQGKVLFFGLDVGRFFPAFGDEEDSKQELRRLGIRYPAGTPPDIKTVETLGISGLPTTVFITPEGEKYRTWVGSLNQKKLAELVDDLLKVSGPREGPK